MEGGKGGAGAATVLMMMVVVFGMVAGQQVSALQTPNGFVECTIKCLENCPWYVPCGAYCQVKCLLPTADAYCHMGCITSTCMTTASSSNSADNEACVKDCGKICGSSPATFTHKNYKLGRNPVV